MASISTRGDVRALGRSVGVRELAPEEPRARPPAEPPHVDRFAAEDRAAQAVERPRRVVRGLEQRVHHARRAVDERRPGLCDLVQHLPGIERPGGREVKLAADRERREVVLLGEIEAERGHHEHAVARVDPEVRDEPVQHVEEAAMADGGGLRPPGRPRGVDDVAEIVIDHAGQTGCRRRARLARDRVALVVDDDPPRGAATEPRALRGAADHDADPGVLDHEGHALRRVVRIDRNIGRACLQHAVDRDHRVDRALQAQTDPGAAAHPDAGEVVRELVRPSIELRVGHALGARHDGERVRRRARLALEQLVLIQLRNLAARPLPDLELGALGRGQHRQRVQRRVRVLDDRREQRAVVPDHPRDRRVIEQRRAVLDSPAQPAIGLDERDRQLELRGARHRLGRRIEADISGLERRHVLERKEHLKQGISRLAAIRPHHLDELLERHVLMRVGVERRVADLPQQRAKRHPERDLGPQHQRVHEATDDALELGPGAVGDRRADDDVGLAGIALDQHVERREQQHERRDALGGRERLKRRGQPLGQREELRRPDERLGVATRPVGRELERRGHPAQRVLPPFEITAQAAGLDELALPCRRAACRRRARSRRRRPRAR